MISRRRHSHFGLAIALALMVLGSLFPPGYMPVNTGHSVVITLCSSGHTKSVTLDLDGGKPPSYHTGSACCDRALPVLFDLPEFIALPALIHPAPLVILPPARFVLPLATAFDPNAPPQAPPLA